MLLLQGLPACMLAAIVPRILILLLACMCACAQLQDAFLHALAAFPCQVIKSVVEKEVVATAPERLPPQDSWLLAAPAAINALSLICDHQKVW